MSGAAARDEMVDGKGGLRQHWRGLFRLAALAAVAVSTAVVVHLLLFDVVYGNPHRTLRETILTLLVTTPIAALSIFLGVLLVFALPHWFQATILGCLVRRLGRWSYAAVLLALPITTVIAWYSYDYLVPSYRLCCLGDSIDSQPYGHGLTTARYVNMLAFQVIATSFTLVWLDASNRSRRRRTSTELLALVVAVVAGGVMGWHLTQGQLHLVSEEKARSRQQPLDGGVNRPRKNACPARFRFDFLIGGIEPQGHVGCAGRIGRRVTCSATSAPRRLCRAIIRCG